MKERKYRVTHQGEDQGVLCYDEATGQVKLCGDVEVEDTCLVALGGEQTLTLAKDYLAAFGMVLTEVPPEEKKDSD